MNDSQSSVHRNEPGVTSNAQLTKIINGQSQRPNIGHRFTRFLDRRATLSVARSMMRHTARPTQSLAGFGPEDSEKLASFKVFRTFAVAMALLASGCSGGSGAGAPITPNSGGVPLANAQSRAPSPTVSASVVQDQQRGPIELLKEFRPIGGLGNVVPGSPELALAPLNFSPNTNDGLVLGPNPRTISNVIAGGTDSKGNNGGTGDPVFSDWLYVFGQFVDHDLDLEATPLTSAPINIIVPAGDPVFKAGTVIAMTRATRNPTTNTIINTTAGYLDLSQLYGSDRATAASLANADGTLKTSGNGLYLPVVNGQYVSGDPRVMENPELTVATTLFMREHNYWVRTLKAQRPNWTGSQLYGMARAITTAEYENIVYTEYLPHLIGPILGGYKGYDSSVNAQVSQEFSTGAFRVGHSQISDTQDGLSNTGATVFTESLAQSFFNTPEIDIANGIDPLLRSLGAGNAQETDPFVVAALRNLLVAGLVGGGVDQIDLIAIDIQRERDAGLGTLNQTRQAMGMSPYTSFAQLTSDPVIQQLYMTTYGSIDNVDLFMGGLAEAHAPSAVVGPTFQAIIGDQFRRLRAGDRYFWNNEGFDPETGQMIAHTTLATLMRRDTATTGILQNDLFIATGYPAPSPAHIKRRVSAPALIDAHGRKPFLDDGK